MQSACSSHARNDLLELVEHLADALAEAVAALLELLARALDALLHGLPCILDPLARVVRPPHAGSTASSAAALPR